MGKLTLVAWLATAIMGYFGLGAFLYERLEGMDPAMLPVAPTAIFVLLALTSLVLSVLWAKNLGSDDATVAPPAGRRKFLLGGAAITGGVVGVSAATVGKLSGWLRTTLPVMNEAGEEVLTAAEPHKSWEGARIQAKRPLGRTGFLASDISIGTGRIMRHSDPEGLFREALDRGVNFIDTSPDYAGAMSETTIGNVLKDRNREELFVVTKWCTSDGHVRHGSSPETYIAALDDSLTRLQTNYVDLIHVHACDDVDRLLDPKDLAEGGIKG